MLSACLERFSATGALSGNGFRPLPRTINCLTHSPAHEKQKVSVARSSSLLLPRRKTPPDCHAYRRHRRRDGLPQRPWRTARFSRCATGLISPHCLTPTQNYRRRLPSFICRGTDCTRLVEGPLPTGKIYDQGLKAQGYRVAGYEGFPRFRECSFEGEYPFGHVNLSDKTLPIQVRVTGYNPFIPLDDKNSGIPCAILEYTLHNTSRRAVKYEFSYHLSDLSCERGNAKAGPEKRGHRSTWHPVPKRCAVGQRGIRQRGGPRAGSPSQAETALDARRMVRRHFHALARGLLPAPSRKTTARRRAINGPATEARSFFAVS